MYYRLVSGKQQWHDKSSKEPIAYTLFLFPTLSFLLPWTSFCWYSLSTARYCLAAARKVFVQQQVTHLVNQEAIQRYGTGYALAGDMHISLAHAALTSTSQQQLSNRIAGKSKQQALHMLSHLDGIQQVSLTLRAGYNDILPQDAGRIQIIVIYRFV